jgi:hypothetical protein
MAWLHVQISEQMEPDLQQAAEDAGLPLSLYLAELLERQVAKPDGWPDGYFEELFGGWQGELLQRPATPVIADHCP